MILTPMRVSTRHFIWFGPENKFVAEISDLGLNFKFERVYDDACDEGLTLVSHRTGDEIVFALNEELKDNDGDVIGWTLKPVSKNVNFTITIFND